MSLYRQAGRRSRWLAASVLASLVVGFVAGFGVARATAEEPSLEDAVEEVQSDAAEAADALELVAIHYATTQDAARQQLERARASFDDVRPELELLSPEDTTSADSAIERLTSLLDQRAAAGRVEQAADEAREAVRRAARLR